MARYNKILAALDSGDTQLAVARRALSIAHDDHAEVLFVHIVDATELEQARIDIVHYTETCKQAIEEKLAEQLATAAKDECIPAVNILVRGGIVNEALSIVAKDYNPDLVICGVRGLSGIKYAFLGSVSTYLVRHMECDVLVVRPEMLDEEKNL
ncbi:MAG: universal stress protein [Eggerthellaceae bacterium]|nr:universal stress protein [Eggerthellaceae bacterium]